MRHERITEKGGITGIVTVRSHPKGTVATILKLHELGLHRQANNLMRRGKMETRQHNLVVYSANCGYDLLVQWLLSAYNGSFAYPLGISWGEIGTGSAQPTNADLALNAPTNRAPVAYAQDSGYNEAVLQFFFPDAVLANQTYYEFGTFVGGNSSIGTGQMFNHALFTTPYSKSSGTDTTCEVDFSFAPQNAAQFDVGVFT